MQLSEIIYSMLHVSIIHCNRILFMFASVLPLMPFLCVARDKCAHVCGLSLSLSVFLYSCFVLFFSASAKNWVRHTKHRNKRSSSEPSFSENYLAAMAVHSLCIFAYSVCILCLRWLVNATDCVGSMFFRSFSGLVLHRASYLKVDRIIQRCRRQRVGCIIPSLWCTVNL